MELKDVILSTLAEMEDEVVSKQEVQQEVSVDKSNVVKKQTQSTLMQNKQELQTKQEIKSDVVSNSSEIAFLESMRERLLVLFEGFQAPNNKNIEAKIDMTLNFLEYILANIDTRVEELTKKR